MKGKGSLLSYLGRRFSPVPGTIKFLSHQLCFVNFGPAHKCLLKSPVILPIIDSAIMPLPGDGSSQQETESLTPQQSIPRRISAHLGLVCPLASTGSALAASGWLDSPRCLMGQSGRSKGISSYQPGQVW